MVEMDDKARLQLQNMIKANNIEDQTGLIRELKHSDILKKDVQTLISLKQKFGEDEEALKLESMCECAFLFNYYTDIYNKIRKDEIDLGILNKFLNVLKQIEDGNLDQHEGSFVVGTLLKEMYIDSALKKADKLDKEHEGENEVIAVEPVKISWKQFKIVGRTDLI
jgi:hypothetical protein